MRIVKKSRLIRFLLVGALNTIFGYSLFVLLTLAGMHYYYAALLSTIGGVLFNFKTYSRLVFGSKNNKLILRFICVYLVIYLLNVEALRIAEALKINILLASAVLVLPMALISFFLNKTFVFRESKS